MMNKNQGAGARFVRNVVMGCFMLLLPRVGWAEGSGSVNVEILPTVVTCPLGAVTTTYSPGLRNTFQPISSTTQSTYDSCVTLLGEPVVSATAIDHTASQGRTCALVHFNEASHTTLRWNTGESSEVTFTLNGVDVQGLLTIETYNGQVLSGKYAGATIVRTNTYVNTDLTDGCFSVEGLTQSRGVSTLTLTLL